MVPSLASGTQPKNKIMLPKHLWDYMGIDQFSIAHLQRVRAPSIYCSQVRMLLAAQGVEGRGYCKWPGWLERHLITKIIQNKNKQTEKHQTL